MLVSYLHITNSQSDNQEIFHPVKEPKHSLPFSQQTATGPYTTHPICFKILFITILRLPSSLFHSGFLTKIFYEFLLSPVFSTCSTAHTLGHSIILTTFGENKNCVMLHDAIFSNRLCPPPSLSLRTHIHTHTDSNMRPIALFSNSLNLQVLHSHETGR